MTEEITATPHAVTRTATSPPLAVTRAAPVTWVDPEMRVGDALELLRRTPGASAAVVCPETGNVVGVLSRPGPAVVLHAPPRLGGMATPLGVYLSDGATSGGAGFWGLFLSGMTLCALALAATALTLALAHGVAHSGAWDALQAQTPALAAALMQVGAGLGPASLTLLLIFAALRLLPLSGTHAAEHQVVHCIERGSPLVPECVRAMPRVHPRCGTNLVAGFLLFRVVFVAVFSQAQKSFSAGDAATLALVCAAPIALLFWRRLGGWMQQWLATRPATDAQIAGAIHAAEQVLSRHHAMQMQGPVRFRPLRRLWTMGLAQTLLGYLALLLPLSLLSHFWPALGHIVNAL